MWSGAVISIPTSNESLRSMGCGVIIFYNLKICLYIETTFPQQGSNFPFEWRHKFLPQDLPTALV